MLLRSIYSSIQHEFLLGLLDIGKADRMTMANYVSHSSSLSILEYGNEVRHVIWHKIALGRPVGFWEKLWYVSWVVIGRAEVPEEEKVEKVLHDPPIQALVTK